ncbi:MAG: hypothetical protein M1830_000421 [Pleopsidium flavum]|nr:MAG: hypothetical protein M1830_000421 [Pleopsidium flavum]
MSQIQKTSKQPSSTPHSIPNTPRTKHKRKREHDGDSGENIRKDEKRPKVLHNRSDGVESIQTQGTEVARAILSEEPVNRQDALEAKSTRKSEIPANKLAKRERRKREREEGLISKPTQNLNGESHSQDPTKSSTNREEGYQKAMEARAVVKEKYKKEGLPAQPTWKVSEPIGGTFIDTEPLFSLDEE